LELGHIHQRSATRDPRAFGTTVVRYNYTSRKKEKHRASFAIQDYEWGDEEDSRALVRERSLTAVAVLAEHVRMQRANID
jgi:hypothetical protein